MQEGLSHMGQVQVQKQLQKQVHIGKAVNVGQ